MTGRRLIDRDDLAAARHLVGAMKDDAPPPGSHERMLQALGLSVAAGVVTGTAAGSEAAAAAGGAKTAALVSGKWLLSGTLIFVAAAAVWFRASVPREGTPPTTTIEPASAPSTVIAQAQATTASSADTVVTITSASAPPASVSAHPSRPARPAPATSSLSLAVALVDAARDALARRDPAAALRSLDRHDGECPSSPLRPESDVLRAEALAMRGDRPAAVALARLIVQRMPGTAHARRAQALIDAEIP